MRDGVTVASVLGSFIGSTIVVCALASLDGQWLMRGCIVTACCVVSMCACAYHTSQDEQS